MAKNSIRITAPVRRRRRALKSPGTSLNRPNNWRRNPRSPDPVQEFWQRVDEAWPLAFDPAPRAIGTERGCVEDQPQRVGSSKTSGACSVLRLVEDDTAALRVRFSGAIQSRLFADVDPTLSRNWTNKPLTGKSPIENWELRICYLLSEEARLAPPQA